MEVTYWDIFLNSFVEFGSYTWGEISLQTSPWYINYFVWLTFLSLFLWGVEIIFPWRRNQSVFRKDFWLDLFYMYFNFYLFKLIIFIAFSTVVEHWFTDVFGGDLSKFALVNLKGFPNWLQLIIFFVALDFVQWITHICLHRFRFLWRFHQVHHSVKEMGFAAHFRYHWMENVIYTPVKYLAMMLIGDFNPEQAFIVYYISIAIGHLNHANIRFDYGWLRFIFNNPRMHIWHHSKILPGEKKYGVNFGISLSCWDYLFKTSYLPADGRDIPLGFEGDDRFPKNFFKQLLVGFKIKP